MYYRFENGDFIEAESFEDAKQKLLSIIQSEKENPNNWHCCTCTGLSHQHDCSEAEIPF